jgi:hypothetical protein
MFTSLIMVRSRFAALSAGTLLVCVVAMAAAQKSSAPPAVHPEVLEFSKAVEIAEGDEELLKKRKERHNAAVSLLDERVSEYKSGSREMNAVFEAARLVAEAKLDLAETPEARVEALELTLKVAQLIEKQLQEQADKGFGSKGDLARAKHARLSVEVELLKAKSQ